MDTSTAATSSDSDPPKEELNLEPPVDEPLTAEDDEDEEEEPTAEPIVQAGVTRGQLDNHAAIPGYQHDVDEAEECLVQQFVQV